MITYEFAPTPPVATPSARELSAGTVALPTPSVELDGDAGEDADDRLVGVFVLDLGQRGREEVRQGREADREEGEIG